MEFRIFNTLTKEKEIFKPIKEGSIGLYSCGPTVYDNVHIGNLRAFVLSDVIRRALEWNGNKVVQVMNITDIDDKTIKRSIEEGIRRDELTKKYEESFWQDIEALNIEKPTQAPRASENIDEMVTIIEALVKSGKAYKATDGIYFSIKEAEDYGALAHIHPDVSSQQERISNDEYDKESPQDFALWKFWKEEDGDNFWDVSIGKGRPGWHIECSAMSTKYLGQTFDIHTGGIDLIFPHHTNEIAQSVAYSGVPLSNYWVHNAHILVDGKKMSKSAGNFFTLSKIIEKGVSPMAYRYWLLTAHYRTQVNFTLISSIGAEQAMNKLVRSLSEIENSGNINSEYKENFTAFINDDLDTPKALALIWDLMKDDAVSDEDKKATVLDFDKVLGLRLVEQIEASKVTIPAEVEKMLEEREAARKNKDWATADELRTKILEVGFEIKDSDSGPRLFKL